MPLIRGLPVPFRGLGAIPRNSLPIVVHPAKERLAVLIALRGGRTEKRYGPAIVLRHSVPLRVHHGKANLRPRVALIRRLPVPLRCLSAVISVMLIEEAQVELRAGVPLLRGLPVPLLGLFEILPHSLAVVVLISQIVLHGRLGDVARPHLLLTLTGARPHSLCRAAPEALRQRAVDVDAVKPHQDVSAADMRCRSHGGSRQQERGGRSGKSIHSVSPDDPVREREPLRLYHGSALP